MTFYEVFKKLCDERGISCKKAAMDMGLSNSTPSKWKKTGCIPKAETLEKVAKYFNVPIESLFNIEEQNDIFDKGVRPAILAVLSMLAMNDKGIQNLFKDFKGLRTLCICNSVALLLFMAAFILGGLL